MAEEPFFPDIITSLPAAKLPISGVSSYLFQGERQQFIFMAFDQDVAVPEHSHGAQWGVVLDGCWDDVTAESPRLFDQAEQVIVDQDGTRRAFPVSEVTAGNGKALLVCERDPGFDYDALAHVLRDRFSPFNTVDGEALVELPSRVRVVQKDGQTTVVATDSVTVNGTMVEPTQTGTSF